MCDKFRNIMSLLCKLLTSKLSCSCHGALGFACSPPGWRSTGLLHINLMEDYLALYDTGEIAHYVTCKVIR